jgi:hypothetical protein
LKGCTHERRVSPGLESGITRLFAGNIKPRENFRGLLDSRRSGFGGRALAALEFGDGLAVVDDRRRPAGEVFDRGRDVDSEVVVDGGEKVARAAVAFDDVFAFGVGRADDLAGLYAAAGPEVGEGAGPVVAAGLDGSRGSARGAGRRLSLIHQRGRPP